MSDLITDGWNKYIQNPAEKALTGRDKEAERKAKEDSDRAAAAAEAARLAAEAAERARMEARQRAAASESERQLAEEDLKAEQEKLDTLVKEGKSEEEQEIAREKVAALKKKLDDVKIQCEMDEAELEKATVNAESAKVEAENSQRLADEAAERLDSMSNSGGLFGMIERDWKKTANSTSKSLKNILNFVNKAIDKIIDLGVQMILNSPIMLLVKLVAPAAAEKLSRDIEAAGKKISEAVKSAAAMVVDMAIATVNLDKKAFANGVGKIVNCISKGLKEVLKLVNKVIDKLLQAGVFLLTHLPIRYLLGAISPGAARAYDKAIQSAADALGAAVKAQLALAVDLFDAVGNAAVALAAGDLKGVGKALSAGMDKAITSAIAASKQILKSACEAVHSLIKAGVSLLIIAVKTAMPGVIGDNLEKMLNGAANALDSLVEETLTAAVTAMDALGESLMALSHGDFETAGKLLLTATMNALMAGANAIGGVMVLAETMIVGALSQILPGQAAMALGIIATLNPRGIAKNVTKVVKEVVTGSGMKKLSAAASDATKKTAGELASDVAKATGKVLDKSVEGFMIANQFIPKGELSPLEMFGLEMGLIVLASEAPAAKAAVMKRRKASATQQQKLQDKKRVETQSKKKTNDEKHERFDTDTKVSLATTGLSLLSTSIAVKEVVDADKLAKENARINFILAGIGQEAALAAAILQLSNNLNDATVSFVKNIGSSVKAAAA